MSLVLGFSRGKRCLSELSITYIDPNLLLHSVFHQGLFQKLLGKESKITVVNETFLPFEKQ